MSPLLILSLIIGGALILFIGGWIAADVTALLVLSILTLTGLVSPEEALAGFSSPAVITILGMFIISAGLTRTGLSYQFGKPLQFFARRSEAALIVALMVVSSLLSALVNTTTVAVIMLPATMELARRSGRNLSRLLLPMAMGCILGGTFTGISTPPNILITEAMSKAGLQPFALFDFTPITGALVIAGILFVVVIGRKILPGDKTKAGADRHNALESSYHLASHLFTTRIRPGSKLAGVKLADSRLGSALSLTVVGLQRGKDLILAPGPQEILRERDLLIVHGMDEHYRYFRGDQHLLAEDDDTVIERINRGMEIAGAKLAASSPLIGKKLADSGLRQRYRLHLLSVRDTKGTAARDPRRPFTAGDLLIVQGANDDLERLVTDGLTGPLCIEAGGIGDTVLRPMRVPAGSVLIGKTLVESRFGNAFGLTVIGILRRREAEENSDDFILMPPPEEAIREDDLLVLQGDGKALDSMQALQELVMEYPSPGLAAELESQQVGITEVLLSPRTTLAGRTLAQLLFREHYGLNVLAVLRKGQPQWSHLREMPLQFGDALLVYGRRQRLEAVAHDPDFVVLDHEAAQSPLIKKAPIAAIITIAVLAAAMLEWTPIAIAALTGAALMVLTGCLSMDQAYRSVEWRVIFLTAGMLPLGVAVQHTGAAQLAADVLISSVGHLGPRWVVATLFIVTVVSTQVVPSSALVVLMAPIALQTAQSLNISAELLMMTLAISVSSNYASPFSHPANMLVMGPGGYRFMDYVKIGVPLTAVVIAVTVWLLPLMWPPN